MTKSQIQADVQPLARVYLEDERADSLLTAAFDKPQILHEDVIALERYQQFLLRRVDVAHSSVGQRALVIVQVLDKTRLAWLLVLLLVISSPLGVIAGMKSHRVEVGAAISTGMFAMIAIAQTIAAWFLR